MKNKKVYIIAGTNGSGKTTFAKMFLPKYVNCPRFVNADLIAKGLSPFSPRLVAIRAGKLVLEQIHELADKDVSFAFETTLAGKSYSLFLKTLKNKGYSIHLFFLWIPDFDIAMARIKERVKDGGHDVPEQDVKRRFYRSIHNFFKVYKPLLDSWILFDNSSAIPKPIAEKGAGKLTIINQCLFNRILKEIGEEI